MEGKRDLTIQNNKPKQASSITALSIAMATLRAIRTKYQYLMNEDFTELMQHIINTARNREEFSRTSMLIDFTSA